MNLKLARDALSGIYKKPNIFLCETDKTRICKLETTDTNISLKFNSYSELTFEVARVYSDIITGERKVNPYFDDIEALRLIELEGIGYFEIQGPDLSSDGIMEKKSITAYSLEYTLSQKYLSNFYTVNGKDEWDGSLEQRWQIQNNIKDENNVPNIVLYIPDNSDINYYKSLLSLALDEVYGWTVGTVDAKLMSLCREINVDRQSVYDFIMNDICEKFNCYATFDTINNKVNLHAESLVFNACGDGTTTSFVLSPPFSEVKTVSVGGYKTTQWEYDKATATLTFSTPPDDGQMIEIVDGGMDKWETDVFISFDNLAQQVQVNYDAESIKTVLDITYGDDYDIREVNNGVPYITNLSYYFTPEWMGDGLYEAYKAYLIKCNDHKLDFTENSQQRAELASKMEFERTREILHPARVTVYHGENIRDWTNGTYYTRSGVAPDYCYTEVSLPQDWMPNTDYYQMDTPSLNEDIVLNLFALLQRYFNCDPDWVDEEKDENGIQDTLSDDFIFMENPTYAEFKNSLAALRPTNKSELTGDKLTSIDNTILNFLNKMWEENGKKPLEDIYLKAFKEQQSAMMGMVDDETQETSNWSQPDNANYWMYYPITLMIKSVEDAIVARDVVLKGYQDQIDALNNEIMAAAEELSMERNFTPAQLLRLSSFLRYDELHLDDIVETDIDDIVQSYKNKKDALESGTIELQKLSQPQLQFSMTMANIFALPEFDSIVDQFKLGNTIKVKLRDGYIKQSRLLQVDMGLDDFSNFSCSFGDLTNIKTQSDIHADLLKNAVQAGQTVADSSSIWTRGANLATKNDLKIQQGLLDATTQIKAIDGTQNLIIDKYGLHAQKKDPITGEISPKQAWFINNSLLFTDDGWETSKTGIGEFTVSGRNFYGVIAEAVLAGYIEGSDIVGGTLKIGDIGSNKWSLEVDENGALKAGNIGDNKWALEVDENGVVTMLGGYIQFGPGGTSTLEDKIYNMENNIDEISDRAKYEIKIESSAPTTFTASTDTAVLTCKVYSWDTDITDTLDDSCFNWVRTSGNAEQDQVWNNTQTHKGVKSITINIDDVFENASFSCKVDLPE